LIEKEEGWWTRQKWGWQDVNEYWKYPDREEIAIEAYTNCVSVELFLNGQSAGSQKLADQEDRILKWILPYENGSLQAIGTMADGREIKKELRTASEPASISLTADRKTLKADFYDLVHIIARLVDQDGNPVKHENRRVRFSVEGDCRVLGIDNGSGSNVEGFQRNDLMTFRGKCLYIVQANGSRGKVRISAESDGLEGREIVIDIK
jgi:hypothetical protein